MKTTTEINHLIDTLTQQLSVLPPIDSYGYPTDEEHDEMVGIIRGLRQYLNRGDTSDEAVESWLNDEDEYGIGDYLAQESSVPVAEPVAVQVAEPVG